MTRRGMLSAFFIFGLLIATLSAYGILMPGISLNGTISSEKMRIASKAFQNGGPIPPKYTCDGLDVNPPLSVFDVPKNAESIVLVVDDPDAPRGTWTHWTVWNINAGASEFKENALPDGGTEGVTSSGKPGYGGPCPPSGTHRYFFKLYALDSSLTIDSKADIGQLENAMEGKVIEKAELVGLYKRR